MPICYNNKLLFVHIPKTGGTSIEKALGVNSLFSETGSIIDGKVFSQQHFTPVILKHILGEEYEGYIRFTFVRNPYTRMLSEYFWRVPGANMSGFERWLTGWVKNMDSDHKLPQWMYLADDLHFVGRFESLQADFARLCDTYGINGGILPKTNSSAGKKTLLVSSMTDKAISVINSVYEKDFELLSYNMIQ